MRLLTKAVAKSKSASVFITVLLAGVLAVNLFVITLAGYSLHKSRQQYERQAGITARNLAHVLEQYIVGTMHKIDMALFALEDEYERQAALGHIDPKALNAYITRQHTRFPELDGLRVTNAAGIVAYGIRVDPQSPVDVTDRDYFQYARSNPKSGLFISRPLFGRISKKWVVVIARRIDNPDGSFAGVVYAGLPLDYFTDTFSRLDIGRYGGISLRDMEMGIITRYPLPKDIGSLIGNKNMSRELRTLLDSGQESGTFFTPTSWDNTQKVVSFKKISGYPLYINVGLDTQDYLAKWRDDVAKMSVFAALFVLLTITMSRVIYIKWRDEKLVAEELRRSKDDLELRVKERTAELFNANELLQAELIERRQAEEELFKSRAMLANVLDSIPQSVFWKDRESNYLGCNKVFSLSAGLDDPAGIVGKSDFDLPWAREDSDNYRNDDRDVIESNLPKKHIVEMLRQADGNRIWIDTSKIPLTDDSGQVYGVLGVYEDITESKKMKEALEHRLVALTSPTGNYSGIQIEDLFNLGELQKIQDAFAAATGVASIITDPQGNPITRPSNFCDLCQDIIRKTEKGLANCRQSDAGLGKINPGGPNMQLCLSGGLWNGGAAIQVGDHHVANWLIGQVLDESCDMDGMMAYGEEIGADPEAYRLALARVPRMSQEQFDNVCRALYLIAGQLSNMAIQNVQQARYISERKLAEESLRNAKEYTENLIQGANVIIVGLDTDGNVTLLNRVAEEISGYSLSELKGQNWANIVTPRETFPEAHKEYEIHNSSSFIGSYENQILTKDGAKRIISWRNNPILENGATVGTISFGIDITEHRRLEEQLRQSLKLESIGRLAGGVAHDFNNKLTVILGYAEMSKLKLNEGDKLWQNLNEISKAALHSRDTTRQLLAFSRQQMISPQPVNLNSAIRETQRTLGRLIGEDIVLTTSLADDLWQVNIDTSQVDQIIMNLAVNARDAMPGGGKLTIATANTTIDQAYCHEYPDAQPGQYVQLTISDNGSGMDRETLKHIFEPFFTTKEIGKGTGLGLATIYGIVSQNNGFINVYSELGHGSMFKIFLPRLEQEITTAASAARDPAIGTGTILLVEDDETVRRMTTGMLEEMGYNVHAIAIPQDAVSFCRDSTNSVDIILSDVIMPGMSGKEMVEKIHAVRPGARVLYMSGYTSDIISQKGVLEEDMHFIQKPFDMHQLHAKIKAALA